jgi:predicted ArsR family transcriptional regulator
MIKGTTNYYNTSGRRSGRSGGVKPQARGRPPPLYSLSVAGGRQAGKRRKTTLMTTVWWREL